MKHRPEVGFHCQTEFTNVTGNFALIDVFFQNNSVIFHKNSVKAVEASLPVPHDLWDLLVRRKEFFLWKNPLSTIFAFKFPSSR